MKKLFILMVMAVFMLTVPALAFLNGGDTTNIDDHSLTIR